MALLLKGTFADASAVAAKVGKEKQFFQLWIESVAALLQDIYYAGMASERVGQRDLLGNLQEIHGTFPDLRCCTALMQ